VVTLWAATGVSELVKGLAQWEDNAHTGEHAASEAGPGVVKRTAHRAPEQSERDGNGSERRVLVFEMWVANVG